MDGIDWEALAEALRDFENACDQDVANAIVAAYREQQRARGVVEVRRDDLARAIAVLGDHAEHAHGADYEAIIRLAVAAKEDA